MKLRLAKFATPIQIARKYSDRGFTLVEILAVMVILGVLTSIILPSMLSVVRRSRLTLILDRVVQKMKEVQLLALENGTAYNLCFKDDPMRAAIYPTGTFPAQEAWQELTPTSENSDEYIFFSNNASGTLTFGATGTTAIASSAGFILGVVPLVNGNPIVSDAKCVIVQSQAGNRRVGTEAECGLSGNSVPPLGSCRVGM